MLIVSETIRTLKNWSQMNSELYQKITMLNGGVAIVTAVK